MSRAAVPPVSRMLTCFAAASLVLGGLIAPQASHAQGLFQAPTPILPTGASPQAVATADFALSGFKSLVVADKNSNSIKVFLGTGTNAFNSGFTYAACRGPVAIATADFNQDGYPDIAVACPSVNTVDVFINQGAAAPGQFGGGVPYSVTDPVALVGGNFVTGNAPGLAVASGNGGVTVFINQSGTLVTKTASVIGNLSGITAGDFNHDGTLDVAVSDYGSSQVHILTNDGSGNLTESGTYTVGSFPSGIASADFNRDGSLDLAVTNSGTNSVTILLGSASGTFTPVNNPQAAGLDPIGLVVTDVNNDGNPDVVAFDAQNSNSTTQGAFAVMLGNGDGTLQTPQFSNLTAVPGMQAAVGDFNRDGKPDLAFTSASTNQVSIALNNTLPTAYPSARSFTAYADQPAAKGNMADGIVAADFNKDGLPDIAVTYLQDNAVRVMLNNGGSFGAAATYAVGFQPYFVATGDINGDGYPDLVVANTTTNNKVGSISVLLNNGKGGNGTFAPAVSYPTGWLPYQVAVGDLNGDGYADVVVAEYGANIAQIFWGSKAGTLTQGPALPTGINPYGVAIGDFAHNGHPDVVVTCYENSQVYVFPNEGNGTFGTPAIYTGGLKPGSIVTGDFNRDGKLDMVVGNTIGNDISFYAGNGDGTFQQGVISPSFNFPVGIAAADINGDGILDIVGVAPNENQISVTLGKGDGTFGTIAQRLQFNSPSQPWAIAVADFNNDGQPDVVTANTYNRVNLAVPAYINMYSKEFPPVNGGVPSVDLLLNASAASISLAANPSSLPAQNNGTTLTATVQPALSGPTPTGSVIFENGSGAPLGTGPYPLNSGTAMYTTGQLGSGQYLFTTLYSGDVNYQPATASGAGFAVTVAGTPVTLTLSSNTAVYGSTITATVSVQGSNGVVPQGTVYIDGAGAALPPITLGANGTGSETVTITSPDFNVGTYQLYAYYTPSNGSSYQPGTSSSQSFTVTSEPTSAALNCSVGFFTTTCSATITNPTTGAAIYPGRVTFSGGPSGTQSNPVNANGVATYIINAGFGGFTVDAQFPAQGNFLASNVATYNVICFFLCGLDRRYEGPLHTLNSLTGLPGRSGLQPARNERIPLPLF
jgi:hypothetical protein